MSSEQKNIDINVKNKSENKVEGKNLNFCTGCEINYSTPLLVIHRTKDGVSHTMCDDCQAKYEHLSVMCDTNHFQCFTPGCERMLYGW